MRHVRVDWMDVWCDHLETTPKDWRDNQPMSTSGWVVRENDALISIAAEVCHGDELHGAETAYRCVTHIPRVYIVRVTETPG